MPRQSPLPVYPPSQADFTPPMLGHAYFQYASELPLSSQSPGHPNFDAVTAWWLSEAALLTYADPAFAIPAFNAAGLTQVKHLNNPLTGTQGYVASNGQHTIIAFRGTEIRPRVDEFLNVFKDIQTDIFFPLWPQAWFARWANRLLRFLRIKKPLRPALQGNVHAGFGLALESVWPQLLESLHAIWGADTPPGPVWVTGHSLGGALASLATVRLSKAGYAIAALYSFAAPRVGNKTFVGNCDTPAFRIMLADDMVPDLPPLPDFYALGQLHRFDRLGNPMKMPDDDTEGRKTTEKRIACCVLDMARAAAAPDEDLIELPFLADHSPLHYALIMARQLPATHPDGT